MGLIKDILEEEVLKPAMDKRILTLSGWVLSYDKVRNCMNVSVIDPRTGGRTILQDVIYCVSMYGFHGIEPRSGFRALVTFDGGNMNSPKVVSTFDDNFGRPHGPFEGLQTEYSARSEKLDSPTVNTMSPPTAITPSPIDIREGDLMLE